MVAEARIDGVSVYTEARRKPTVVFELALTYEGIEIRRSGEPPRYMSWDRVTEWEIKEGRGGVILTLRGGGAVTPLVIPRWNVDDLDSVLSRVTSEPPPLTSEQPVRPDSGGLVWPEDAPLDGISSLSWPDKPTEAEAEDADTSEFVLPDGPPSAFVEDTVSDEPFRLPEPEQILGASTSEVRRLGEELPEPEQILGREASEASESAASTESTASTASEIKRRADEELARLKAALLKEEFRQGS